MKTTPIYEIGEVRGHFLFVALAQKLCGGREMGEARGFKKLK